MNCDKCGKNMTIINEDGTSTNVFGFQLNHIGEKTDALEVFMREQFGKYTKNQYNFCFECYLDSLFGWKDVN